MEKSHGKPVPVNCGSSQVPSGSWVRTSQSTPRSTAGLARPSGPSPAASSAISAHAVCEAVESPRPAQRAGSS